MPAPENLKELNLYQRMNHIMLNISGVSKDKFVPTNNSGAGYTAVTHDDVTRLLHNPIADMGIIVIPSMTKASVNPFMQTGSYGEKQAYRADVWVDVTFVNADKPEERLTISSFAYGMDSSDKATGKAYSMAVKYAYLKGFMLESYDDEESRDHEHSNRGSYNQAPASKTPPKPAPKPAVSNDTNEDILNILDLMKTRMGILTEGQTPEQKGFALVDRLGVKRFDDLKNKTLDQLMELNRGLARAIDGKKPKQPTFKLEG